MELTEIFRSLFALIFVVGLIALCAYVARRQGWAGAAPMGSGDKRLKVVESLMLDPRHRAMVLRDGDTDHLIVLGPQGVVRLDHIEPPATQDAVPNLSLVGTDRS